MNKIEYQAGQSFNIGLSFSSITGDDVDVTTADDVVVKIVQRSMMQTKFTYKKSDGTLTISQNKGLITVHSTSDMVGEYIVSIDIITADFTRTAVLDNSLYFNKIN